MILLRLSLWHVFLDRINKPFYLKNALDLTGEYLYKNFYEKIFQKVLVKIFIQKVMCQI